MKGLVFAEFLEMVENTFSLEIADRIIEEANLPSGGSYTSIGTYDHGEILELVTHLSRITQIPVNTLVEKFGEYLFGRFVEGFPAFFAGIDSAFGFLQNIEEYIHVEVRKLYPDAELPVFTCETPDTQTLIMTYRSKRPFADLAEGLIRACISHYGGGIELARENLSDDGTAARFTLTR
jgi:hypothetical protein